MKSIKSKPKKPETTRSTKQLEGLSKSEGIAYYSAILVANLQLGFKMILEKLESFEENFTRKMDVRFNEQNMLLERILDALTQKAQGYNADIKELQTIVSQ